MASRTVRIEGLTGTLDMLRNLPPELVSKNGGPVKLALMAAARVLQAQAQANVQAIIDEQNVDGVDSKTTGLLKKSIRVARARMPSGVKGERAGVFVNSRNKYPENRAKNGYAVQVGRQLEYGTEKRDAKPWLRPAFDSKKEEATATFVSEVNKRGQALINKMARAARAKK